MNLFLWLAADEPWREGKDQTDHKDNNLNNTPLVASTLEFGASLTCRGVDNHEAHDTANHAKDSVNQRHVPNLHKVDTKAHNSKQNSAANPLN